MVVEAAGDGVVFVVGKDAIAELSDSESNEEFEVKGGGTAVFFNECPISLLSAS